MALEINEGSICWSEAGFAPGRLSFVFDDATFSADQIAWNGDAGYLPNGLGFTASASKDGILQFSFRNGKGPLFLQKIVLEFPPSLPAKDYREYSHSRLFYEQVSGVKPLGRSTDKLAANPPSYLVYMWSGPQQLLLAEMPEFCGNFVEFKAVFDTPAMDGLAGMSVVFEEDRDIQPDAEFVTTPLLFRREDASSNPLDMLEELGDLYAAARKFPLKPNVCGWNSYSNRGMDIFPEYILENERNLLEFSKGKISCFVTDDGWQICYGAWQANAKFADGMEAFCKKVVEAGGIPGIWTAPLLLDNSYMFPKEWRLLNKEHNRWILDVSRDDVLQHIASVYRHLKEIGFRYFKVDFTNFILGAERPSNLRAGRGGVIRKLYETIREAIGWDCYMMGCCCIMDAAFGIVDAERTSADNYGFWSIVDMNMCATASRWWQNKRLWNNDPDYLDVRGPDTSAMTEPGYVETYTPYQRGVMRSGPRNNEHEAAAFALFIYMAGGELLFGDNFAWLNDRGKALMKRLLDLPALDTAARPVDMFTSPDNDVPMLWFEAKSGKLAIFNPTDAMREFHIRFADYHKQFSTVFWPDPSAKMETDSESMTLTLLPHHAIGIM